MRQQLSTVIKQNRFLEIYAQSGNLTHAAKMADIHRSTHFAWMKDPDYAEKFASVKEEAIDLLEAEALRRAVQGVEDPVFHRGQVCGHVRKYSDVLLIFLLKAARPGKFRDRLELTDPSGRNPLTAALEELWKCSRAGNEPSKGDAKQIPSDTPIEAEFVLDAPQYACLKPSSFIDDAVPDAGGGFEYIAKSPFPKKDPSEA